MKRKIAALAFTFSIASGCTSGDEVVTMPVAVGMSSQLAPAYDDGDTRIYQVGIPVQLPIRRGTTSLPASDLRVQIRFTISNLDDQKHSVELLVDPWNEFVRYRPGIQAGNEEAVPDLSGFDKFFVVPGKSHITGIITSDDCTELAIDLATAQAIVAAPPPGQNVNGMINRLFNLQNRSNVPDPLISPHIPKAIPAMFGFDLGLRAYESGNVAVEVIVDVTDLNGDRVVTSGDASSYADIPSAVLSPPAL